MNCSICGREIEFHKGRGWLHKETNSLYIMKCKDCGYEGRQVMGFTCPNCGGKNYVDDHCSSPNKLTNKKDKVR